MKRRKLNKLLVVFLTATMVTGCGVNISISNNAEQSVSSSPQESADNESTAIKYHIADKDEAVECFMANDDYFDRFSLYDIQYRAQKNIQSLFTKYGVTGMKNLLKVCSLEEKARIYAMRNAVLDASKQEQY